MDKIEKIRQEIERHRQAIRVLNEHTAPDQTSKTCAIFQYSDTILSELLSFLDTLQVDEPEGLDEAAEKYVETQDLNFLKPEIVKRIFKAGAEWMANRNSWKPSDEQMDCLKETIIQTKGYQYSWCLPELYEQLKKLKICIES